MDTKSNDSCPLCDSSAVPFWKDEKRGNYFQCENCHSVYLNKDYHITKEAEKERYLLHNNDINDPRYLNFLTPVVEAVEANFTKDKLGLDFGAGPGPILANHLRQKGYSVNLYDLFFWNDPTTLQTQYDFIICTEVMEHFQNPKKEFELLKNLLNPKGKLLCMTDTFSESIDFPNWHYRRDLTHIFFYHEKALEYISSRFQFHSYEKKGRLIQFSL
ncbi:methyltransferase [Leptospira kobayashii]|uniref:Methyltransferase n=1 Tax=Leptospira kobayashii TaxID=1917830 RepID=A0ABN6KFP2_9LEPT|nr:class I SAM-dependent methyltransferase [Leptospira kobayashii]BDA79940.1 methyltransferase [Leptospira kobayashii]